MCGEHAVYIGRFQGLTTHWNRPVPFSCSKKSHLRMSHSQPVIVCEGSIMRWALLVSIVLLSFVAGLLVAQLTLAKAVCVSVPLTRVLTL